MADERRVKRVEAAENMGPSHRYLVTLSNNVRFFVDPAPALPLPMSSEPIRLINISRRDIFGQADSGAAAAAAAQGIATFREPIITGHNMILARDDATNEQSQGIVTIREPDHNLISARGSATNEQVVSSAQFPLYTIPDHEKPNVVFIGQISATTTRDKFKAVVEKAVNVKIGERSIRKIFAKKSRIYRKFDRTSVVYQFGFAWFDDSTAAKLAVLHFRNLKVDRSRWTSYRVGLQNENIDLTREILSLDTFECREIDVIFDICRELGNSKLRANIDLVRFRSITFNDLAEIVTKNIALLTAAECGIIFRMICDGSFISNRFENRQRLIELDTLNDSSASNSEDSDN